jgi:class 3 adenylate cyclase/pimeloyl-ACP methyl ester carboxylesterase
MEPRIQYARTADGVSIAFYAMGEGMPLVAFTGPPFSHIQMAWQIPEWRRFREQLAERRMVIGYDSRGTGLSDRDATGFSLDAQMLDLEAVVDYLGLQQLALFASTYGGPMAIAYAARHPERISHLILWCTYARGSDFLQSPQVGAIRGLLNQDWQLFTETVSHVYMGWPEGKPARQFAAWLRESVTQEAAAAAYGVLNEVDVSPLLGQVRSPTLVFHRREYPLVGVDIATGLASRILDARLVLLEGASAIPFLGDTGALSRAIDEFLSEGEEPTHAAEAPEAGAFRTVLFTDVEGSTSMMQRLGDAKGRAVLREHERITREALKAHSGTEVKTMGDGFMACFSSATRALECAIAMQRAFAEQNAQVGAQHAAPLHVRIGLNAGEPIEEEKDLFGTAVILAARIAAKAEGGEILASDVVRQLVAGKGFLFSDRGDVVLRGFEDPVRLYEVRWREDA